MAARGRADVLINGLRIDYVISVAVKRVCHAARALPAAGRCRRVQQKRARLRRTVHR
jgi:hypothetical protein